MPLPEETLEKIAADKLETVLMKTNDQLKLLLDKVLHVQEVHEDVLVNFDVLMYEDVPQKYRVVVYAWDDGSAREEFPVMASAIVTFEV